MRSTPVLGVLALAADLHVAAPLEGWNGMGSNGLKDGISTEVEEVGIVSAVNAAGARCGGRSHARVAAVAVEDRRGVPLVISSAKSMLVMTQFPLFCRLILFGGG